MDSYITAMNIYEILRKKPRAAFQWTRCINIIIKAAIYAF